ncbi:hypothetical protein AQPW35_29070 [Rubrivivax pictus]|uniref:Uncharacterized protein n=1 Tax=Pseudaquabacterium pictum TaxID=2315236 RepID=A0A480ASA8_9BURK|nr:hypothetical protein AQPW35_29070 [Rubrivivax pictus]
MVAAEGPAASTTTVLRIVTLSPTPSDALKLVGEMVSANTVVDASAIAAAVMKRPNFGTELIRLYIRTPPQD